MYESLYHNKRPEPEGQGTASGRPATPGPLEGPPTRHPRREGDRRFVVFFLCIGVLVGLAAVDRLVNGLWMGSLPMADPGWYEEHWGGPWEDGWYDGHNWDEDDGRAGDAPAAEPPRCAARLDLRLTLDDAPAEKLSYQDIYRQVLPSIVGIRSWDENGRYSGTGVVVAADGYVLTNEHVVAGCDRASVVLPDGTVREAELVGWDAYTDLALLKIQASGLVPAAFGHSDVLEVGEAVLAIGNPLSERFWGTMTDGIISATDRYMETDDGRYIAPIQTTAAINSGNSGGALINEYGQVVGITNMKMVRNSKGDSVEGLGFAIPSATVREMVHQFVAESSPTQARLGITVRPVTQWEHEEEGLPYGLYVDAVEPGCHAAELVRAGDVLLTANGQTLEANSDLLLVRAPLKPGDTVRFELEREGERKIVVVRLYREA